MSFVHLHVHSDFSLLDGFCSPEDIASGAKALDMPAIALTDHGNLYGAFKFFKACRGLGIKPIFGQEFYIVPDHHKRNKEMTKKVRHIVLLAKNLQGWKNLIKLHSIAFIEGFYYRPRIDPIILTEHHEGLIALSGCSSGIIAKAIIAGDVKKVMNSASFFKDLFGNDFYLEIMPIAYEKQKYINKTLVSLSKKADVKLVATADCHYIKREDYIFHQIAIRVRSPNFEFESNDLWLRSEQEMIDGFKKNHNIPEEIVSEAMETTIEIANKVDDFSIVPKYNIPEVEIDEPGASFAASMI